jgi:hypothetical protein
MSIKIERIVGPSIHQWEAVIRGMRNPMNSWAKSDSEVCYSSEVNEPFVDIGEADMALMRKLAKAGSDHRKYLRQLPVIMDVTAPRYWWAEADQYKVSTVTNSCSTMHTIHKKEFVLEDFSWDRLLNCECDLFTIESDGGLFNNTVQPLGFLVDYTIPALNRCRELYLETGNEAYWDQMIQLLPQSYNQKRTWSMNYEVLWNMYQARKGHKLKEWREFCQTIVREVPYFAEIFEI